MKIVPTERQFDAISARGADAETIGSFEQRLFVALLPDRREAPPELAMLALVRALDDYAAATPLRVWTTGSTARRRTATAVAEALAVARQAGCRDTLARMARDGFERAALLSFVWDRQDAILSDLGMVDHHAIASLLAEAVTKAAPARVAELLGDVQVTVRFAVGLPSVRLALLRALDDVLAKQGGRATVEVPTFDERLDPSRASGPLDRLADALAAALDAAPAPTAIVPRLGDFRFASPPSPATAERVSLAHATDATAQAWAVAAEVRAAFARGVPPEAVAIAAPDPAGTSAQAVRQALEESGVVVHGPFADSPLDAPLVDWAMRALAVADLGLPRHETAHLLVSTYAEPRALTGLSDDGDAREALAQIARALRATSKVRGADAVESVERTVARAIAGRRRAREGQPPLSSVAAHAASVLTHAVSGRTRAEHTARARAFWATVRLGADAAPQARQLLSHRDLSGPVDEADLAAVAKDARGWDGLCDALDRYEAAAHRLGLSDVPIANAIFREELTACAAAYPARLPARRAGAVRIARAADLAGEALGLVVFVDCNEGAFLEGDALPSLFSPSFERRLTLVDARFPTATRRADAAAAQVALAAASAERVVLVHRGTDDEGGIVAPSRLFDWLAAAGVAASVGRPPAVHDPPFTEDHARVLHLLLHPDDAERVSPEAGRRARVELLRERFFAREADAVRAPAAGVLELSPALRTALTRDTGGADAPMAVTSLERFATCAFQGYASQVLRVREERPNDDAPAPREQGSIVHGALAAAFAATQPMWKTRPRDAHRILASALDAADAFLERSTQASGVRRLAKDDARRDVLRVLEWSLQDESWDFVAAEQAFGDGAPGSWPPVVLAKNGVQLSLRGSIDRLDAGHGRAAVRAVDYKLSDSRAQQATRSMGELTFQLPVYAKTAADHLGARERAGVYVPTRLRGPLPVAPTRAQETAWARAHEAEEGLAAFEARALQVLGDARDGNVSPVPHDTGACDLCAFDGGCRKPRFVISAEHDDDLDRERVASS